MDAREIHGDTPSGQEGFCRHHLAGPGQPPPNVVVWKRVVSTGQASSKWSKFKPGILQLTCGSATTKTYEFLVVPIAQQPVVSGVIKFRREKDAKCKCDRKTQGHEWRSQENRDRPQARQEPNGTGHQTSGTWSARPPVSELATRLSPTLKRR